MADETLPAGTILNGRYCIERVLGSGGFGHVYLTLDHMTSQLHALKEYLVTGSSGQEQLKHEATVLRQLHHPNLPAFQDAFIERGRYYVVLNYIEGHDLTDLIRITRQRNDVIPIRRIMGWLLSICDAVRFLHSQRPPVIHRDIKPDNIRITPNGTAILVDLGNAKAAADGARTLFFIRHQGTPGYAPPEQYPGGVGTDARSDVYALGATLYFALTAHEPPSVSIRNESIQRGRPDLPSLQEVLANNPPEESAEAHAARQFRLGVTRPSKPAPRHLRHVAQLGALPPDLLNQLNRVIQRAMAMRPKDRYPGVADFANDLNKVMQALPLPTPPQPPPHKPDPHSTQPDLPELYDALQAAKDNNTSGISDTSTAPMDAPSSPRTPPSQIALDKLCPRCSSPLIANAAYCSRCGASLNSGPHNSSAISNTSPKKAAGDETVLYRNRKPSQSQQHAVGPGFSPPMGAVTATPSMNAGQSGQMNPIKPQVQQALQVATPFPQATPHSGGQPSVSPFVTSTSPRSSGPDLKVLIISLAACIVLAVLIAVLVFSLIQR
jgi:serine/threonine protein kinase